ncbi:MAG TPA: hypothetical protein PKH80_08980, partial [Methanofastidiosum sp.]|nr:hypothetical protein [Methanofastidiosum sp.]
TRRFGSAGQYFIRLNYGGSTKVKIERLINFLVLGFIGEAMEDEDIDNVVIQGEPSPEEIAESDREGIRIAAKEVNYELTPAEIEDIRKGMLKSLILKIVAANSLVPDNVKEDDFETILALYTNVLSNMLKK